MDLDFFMTGKEKNNSNKQNNTRKANNNKSNQNSKKSEGLLNTISSFIRPNNNSKTNQNNGKTELTGNVKKIQSQLERLVSKIIVLSQEKNSAQQSLVELQQKMQNNYKSYQSSNKDLQSVLDKVTGYLGKLNDALEDDPQQRDAILEELKQQILANVNTNTNTNMNNVSSANNNSLNLNANNGNKKNNNSLNLNQNQNQLPANNSNKKNNTNFFGNLENQVKGFLEETPETAQNTNNNTNRSNNNSKVMNFEKTPNNNTNQQNTPTNNSVNTNVSKNNKGKCDPADEMCDIHNINKKPQSVLSKKIQSRLMSQRRASFANARNRLAKYIKGNSNEPVLSPTANFHERAIPNSSLNINTLHKNNSNNGNKKNQSNNLSELNNNSLNLNQNQLPTNNGNKRSNNSLNLNANNGNRTNNNNSLNLNQNQLPANKGNSLNLGETNNNRRNNRVGDIDDYKGTTRNNNNNRNQGRRNNGKNELESLFN